MEQPFIDMYIDAHCHLTGDEYEGGAPVVIARANADGVGRIVASGFDMDSSYASAKLADEHACVYFCAGFHPSELGKYREGDLEGLAELIILRPQTVSIGLGK